MSWRERCFFALDAEKLFESPGHRSRFKELVDCYGHQPFFTKGLCKCVYLSAWDEEHFCIMLETLMKMSLGKEPDTGGMRIQGDVLAERQNNSQAYIYRLSNAFLDDEPFHLPEDAKIEPDILFIIRRALQASKIIDEV